MPDLLPRSRDTSPMPAPGYSGTPLVRKLGIKPGHHLVLLNAPAAFESLLIDLPGDVTPVHKLPRSTRPIDAAIAFATRQADMARHLDAIRPRLAPAGAIWAAWPKRASGVPTDLTEDVIRGLALHRALVDNKVCAITDIWSGLRLVIRLKDRPTG